jgi:transposase
LIWHRNHDPHPDLRERCAALLKVAEGETPYAVARGGLLKPRDPDTVYGWLDLYEREGLLGLLLRRHGGPRRRPLDRQKREEVLERLRQGPAEEARQESAPTPAGPSPSRWKLRTVRATFQELREYTLSGVWRWLRGRVGVKFRAAEVQQYSPDPDYGKKFRKLKKCLKEAARRPGRVVAVFLDEMGYSIWPDPARDWIAGPPAAPPLADRQQSPNGLWRIIGALNAVTGQVSYLDGYIVGRAKVIQLYRRLAEVYPKAETIYVIQDNWSIHTHEDVLEALAAFPQIKPVWLPTYAPWLNPIEKLWRWLREDVLKLHRLASDWPALRKRVNAFLDQFATGGSRLLHYVGLLGKGKLAQAVRGP